MKRHVIANYSEEIIKSQFTDNGETLISSAALVKVKLKGKSNFGGSLSIKESSTDTVYELSNGEETPLLDGSSGIYCTKDEKESRVNLAITEYTFSSYSEIGNGLELPSNVIGANSSTLTLGGTSVTKTVIRGDITLDKTVTAPASTGAKTINKASGTVNFAAEATSLVVTNSLVAETSIIQLTVGTNDTTMKSAVAVAAAGSFTIYPNAAPTAETRVNFTVTN